MTAPPPPAVPLTREEVDQALATLGPAYDRVATAMFGLDSHAGPAFLRGGGLTGHHRAGRRGRAGADAARWLTLGELAQSLEHTAAELADLTNAPARDPKETVA